MCQVASGPQLAQVGRPGCCWVPRGTGLAQGLSCFRIQNLVQGWQACYCGYPWRGSALVPWQRGLVAGPWSHRPAAESTGSWAALTLQWNHVWRACHQGAASCPWLFKAAVLGLGVHGFAASCLDPKASTEALCLWLAAKSHLCGV